jgi:hypothetical protein
MDKFFYTGSIETFAVDDAQDAVGRLGRLGMGLKTEVEGWELETGGLYLIVKGRLMNKPYKEYVSEEQALRLLVRKWRVGSATSSVLLMVSGSSSSPSTVSLGECKLGKRATKRKHGPFTRSVGRYDQFHGTNVEFWDHRPQILGHEPYFYH